MAYKSNQEYIDSKSEKGYYGRSTNLLITKTDNGFKLTDAEEDVLKLTGKNAVKVDFDASTKESEISLNDDEVWGIVKPYLPEMTTVSKGEGINVVNTNADYNVSLDKEYMKQFVIDNAPKKVIKAGFGIVVDDSDYEATVSIDENLIIDEGEYNE